MKKMKNNVEIQGYVFSHTLANRVSKKNVPFINGRINVATDEAGTNVIPVNFTYVSEYWGKTDKPNTNYDILQGLIDDCKTFEECGTAATKVRISGNIDTNDFVNRDGEMASPKQVSGSFVHLMTTPIADNPSTFDADMVITSAIEREVEDGPDYVQLKGYCFDFRGTAVPVDLNIRSKSGMAYFLDQEPSSNNPFCTEVKGEIISTTIETEVEEEGAFGEPIVNKTSRPFRTWDVTWAAKEPYEWDDEDFITKKEMKSSLAAHEEHLADVKRRHDEYIANRDGGQSFKTADPSAGLDDDDDDFAF